MDPENWIGATLTNFLPLDAFWHKEVCKRGVACSLLKLDGSLQATPSITKFLPAPFHTQCPPPQPPFRFSDLPPALHTISVLRQKGTCCIIAQCCLHPDCNKTYQSTWKATIWCSKKGKKRKNTLVFTNKKQKSAFVKYHMARACKEIVEAK